MGRRHMQAKWILVASLLWAHFLCLCLYTEILEIGGWVEQSRSDQRMQKQPFRVAGEAALGTVGLA